MNKPKSDVAQGCYDFASKLHKTIIKSTEKIVVHSSFGIHNLLSYLSFGAKGATKTEMVFGLYLYNRDTLHLGFRDLIAEIDNLPVLNIFCHPRSEAERQDVGSNMVNVASAIFVDESISLNKGFQELGTNCFPFEYKTVNSQHQYE